MIMDVNDASDSISMKTFSSLEQAMEKENILKITKIDGFEILNPRVPPKNKPKKA